MKTTETHFATGWLLAAACLTVLCLHASADQFVQATNPGWTNSSQYSWTGAWGDVNNDGYLDLLAAGEAIQVCLNQGDGTFRPAGAEESGSRGDMKSPFKSWPSSVIGFLKSPAGGVNCILFRSSGVVLKGDRL